MSNALVNLWGRAALPPGWHAQLVVRNGSRIVTLVHAEPQQTWEVPRSLWHKTKIVFELGQGMDVVRALEHRLVCFGVASGVTVAFKPQVLTPDEIERIRAFAEREQALVTFQRSPET